METGKRHLASLDSLRGIGVILIFADHFILPNYYIFFGWIGLWIFFALSGYLITDGLLKMKDPFEVARLRGKQVEDL